MPADVEIDISVRKKGDGADKVARDLKGAARAADDFSDELAKVERKLIEVRALSAAAGKEFLKTGDSSPLKQLLKDERELKQVQKSLRGVTDEVKTLKKEATSKDAGGGFLDDLIGSIPAGIGKGLLKVASAPELVAIGGAIAAPLAAGIAAALAGAALATTAAAGLAGGIVLAAGSREVHQAWAAVGSSMLDELRQASVPLVDPLVNAAHTIGDAIHAEIPTIRDDFAALAPAVDKLATGTAGFIRAFDPGFSNALKSGEGVLERVADELPNLGHSVGFFFDQLSQGAAGGGDALIITLQAAEFSVEALGSALHDATVSFELFSAPLIAVSDQVGGMDVAVRLLTGSGFVHLAEALTETGDKTKQTGSATDQLYHKMVDAADAAKKQADEEHRIADEARYAKQALKELQDFVSAEANTILGAQQAQLGFNQSLNTMKDTLKENNQVFDQKTEKGIKDREVVLAAAQAAVELRDRTLALTGSTEQADAAFQGAIIQIRAAGHEAHLTDAQIDGIIGSLQGLHSPPAIIVDLKRLGYSDGQIENLKEQIGQLHNKLTTIQIDYISRHIDVFGTNPGAGQGRFGGQAKGGVFLRAAQGLISGVLPPRSPGTMVLAGEPQTGGEAFIPFRGITRQRAMALASVVGDRYGFSVGDRAIITRAGAPGRGAPTYNLTVNAGVGADGQDVGSQIVAVIRQYEQRNGTTWRT